MCQTFFFLYVRESGNGFYFFHALVYVKVKA